MRPCLRTEDVAASSLLHAELFENTIGTITKLLYAFFWQESIIDLGGLNESPAINEAGAAFTPQVNMFANNLTRWDLFVGDVQVHENIYNISLTLL